MLWENIESSRQDDMEFLAGYMLGVVPACCHAGRDEQGCKKRKKSVTEDDEASPTTVHNMVSTSILCCSEMPINLSLLAALLPCSTYDKRRFAAITIRLDNPRCTALLFTSGKLVITGVKSW